LKRAVRHRSCLIGFQQGQWCWHFEIPDWIGILGKKKKKKNLSLEKVAQKSHHLQSGERR
jgi:hypothetical protein